MISSSLLKGNFRYRVLFSLFLAIFLLSACGVQSDNRAGYNDPHKIVDLFIDKVSDDGLTHGVVGSACKYKYILLSLYYNSNPINGAKELKVYSDNRIFIIFYTSDSNNISILFLGLNIDSSFGSNSNKGKEIYRIAESQFLRMDSAMQEDSLDAERFIVLFIHAKEKRRMNDDFINDLLKNITKSYNYKITECGFGEHGEWD